MRRAVRVGLVVLGAAMAVYGAASVTGGWLGTPPWRETEPVCFRPPVINLVMFDEFADEDSLFLGEVEENVPCPDEPRSASVWISGGVVAAGLALVEVGAWPRRRSWTAS